MMNKSAEIRPKESTWYATVGMVLINLTDKTLINSLSDAWEETADRRRYYEEIVNIYRDIEAVLRKCPDVKNLRWLGDLREEHFEPFDHDNAVDDDWFLQEASAFLYFELFMPKSERRYAFDVRYHDKVIEKAHVIYNGSLFLAFAETTDEVSPVFFGQEIREFLVSRLISNRWAGVVVPPCPLHPDITVKASAKSKGFQVTTDEENDIEVLLPLSEMENPVDFFEYFLFSHSFSISHFLSACTTVQRTEKTSRLIEDNLASLTDNYSQLLRLPWHRILKQLSLMRSSRQMALAFLEVCNEFARYRLASSRAREAFAPQTAEAWNDNPFRPYFFRHLREPDFPLSQTREAVKHMTDIVSQRYLQYSTILAALAGGVVGAVITNIPLLFSVITKWLKN